MMLGLAALAMAIINVLPRLKTAVPSPLVALALIVLIQHDCRKLLKKARGLVEVNVIEDPQYFVATNR